MLGKFLAYTGTDVMWYVTPNSLKTMFTGMELAITMQVVAFDLKASTIPDKSDITTALKFFGAPLSNLATDPLISDKFDFLDLVLKYVPSADIPKWCKKDKSGNYIIQIGTVSPVCASNPKSFGLTVAGIPTGSSASDISAQLIKIVKQTAHNDMKKMLADCTSNSFPMSIPSMSMSDFTISSTKTPQALVCAFQGVAVTSNRRTGTTTITGKTHSGAGMNAGGLNSVMQQAIAKGAKITLGGKSISIPKTQAGITTCTTAEKTAAGTTGGCGDLVASAATQSKAKKTGSTGSTTGSTTGSSDKGMSGGAIAGVVIAVVVVVGVLAGVGIFVWKRNADGTTVEMKDNAIATTVWAVPNEEAKEATTTPPVVSIV